MTDNLLFASSLPIRKKRIGDYVIELSEMALIHTNDGMHSPHGVTAIEKSLRLRQARTLFWLSEQVKKKGPITINDGNHIDVIKPPVKLIRIGKIEKGVIEIHGNKYKQYSVTMALRSIND